MKSMQHHYLPLYTNSAQRAELYHDSAFSQSFSGSETDVSASTSTENLTHEEKYVLRNSQRQEPQGEEDCNGSGDLNLSPLSSSPYDTLVLRKTPADQSMSSEAFTEGNDSSKTMTQHGGKNGVGLVPPSPQLSGRQLRKPPMVPFDRAATAYNLFYQSNPGHVTMLPQMDVMSPKSPLDGVGMSGIQSLDQSSVLKHLAKEMGGSDGEAATELSSLHHRYFPAHLPPPPSYPHKWRNHPDWSSRRATLAEKRKLTVSRSQPDLTRVGVSGRWEDGSSLPQRPKTRGRAMSEADHEALAAANASEMIVILTKENLMLKAELDMCFSKISKLSKLEMEIQNIHQSYEDLVKSSEKREHLARAVRTKLEMELRRLQELNRDLMGQLDIATSHLSKRQPEEFGDLEFRKEINRRYVLIAQLITQNRELVAAKERQEVELAAQRVTLQEQRTHIDILESALDNAQANVLKVEEESRKKQAYVDRVAQLQKALTSLQVASDKREKMEKHLRNQLEKEILELRSQGASNGGANPSKDGKTDEIAELKHFLRDTEEKLMATQAEVTKWEQRYLEEIAMRQIAIDAAATPKDARIAALERTSQESERLIAQARCDKLKHMDELHAVNKRSTDLETKIKDLESKLAEKDAMIKVLQKHSIEKDMAYHNAILRSPRHTPHASFHAVQLSTNIEAAMNEDTDYCSENVDKSVIPAVAAALSSLSVADITSPSPSAIRCNDASQSSASLSMPSPSPSSSSSGQDELRNIDSQVLSKDSIIQALRTEKERFPSHFWRV